MYKAIYPPNVILHLSHKMPKGKYLQPSKRQNMSIICKKKKKKKKKNPTEQF